MSKEQKEIFTIDKNTEEVTDYVIGVVSTKEEAQRRVKILNERFAHDIELDEDMCDAAETEENAEIIQKGCPHLYYNVGSFYVDEKFYFDNDMVI